MTTIINLYGGPGTGKSTSAAYLYYLFKSGGHNVELVREYVKDWAWEGRKINTYDQMYFLGKQIRRETLLYKKVDYIVTDSPILLGVYYSRQFSPKAVSKGVEYMTQAFYDQAKADGHEHVHLFLRRSKPYNESGRYQTESEAKEIDAGIWDLLEQFEPGFVRCETDADSLRNFYTSLTT